MTDIKKFISNFNFVKPNFENVPEGFPRLSKKGLSVQEGYLFDAIITEWIFSRESFSSSMAAYIKTSEFVEDVSRVSLGVSATCIVLFSLISTLYYLNIEYRLGLTFLTEFFA